MNVQKQDRVNRRAAIIAYIDFENAENEWSNNEWVNY